MEIDKNIPIPKARESYPIKDMGIGDSILVPVYTNFTSSAKKYRKLGWKFRRKKEGNGFRLWRIK